MPKPRWQCPPPREGAGSRERFNMDIRDEVVLLAKRAKEASARLAVTTAEERNGALAAMAAALREHASEI